MMSLPQLSRFVLAGASTLSLAVLPLAPVLAASGASDYGTYNVQLKPLNGSKVSGMAKLTLEGNQLRVQIDASGLEAGLHPQHIHGSLTGADASCPTPSADTNHDGYVSVVEGAPFYGPIKVNLTSMQTAFGTPPTLALFAPFAGTPDNMQFPMVGSNGEEHFSATYLLDMPGEAAMAARGSLMPLIAQHIVLHGGQAPMSVDTANGDASKVGYDALLPVACGQVEGAMTGNGMNPTMPSGSMDMNGSMGSHDMGSMMQQPAGVSNSAQNAWNAFDAQGKVLAKNYDVMAMQAHDMYVQALAKGGDPQAARNDFMAKLDAARDQQVSHFYEARNTLVDALNQSGETALRDSFLSSFDSQLHAYTMMIDSLKMQWLQK